MTCTCHHLTVDEKRPGAVIAVCGDECAKVDEFHRFMVGRYRTVRWWHRWTR